MSCRLCEAFLHDYFTQPLERENPLYDSINQKRLQEHIPSLIYTLMRIYSSTNRFVLQEAKSNMDNYCCFMKKPDNKYQEYEIYYQFLKQNKKLQSELLGATGDILDIGFLKVRHTDKHAHIVERWLAFILGSIFQELYELHADHTTKQHVWQFDTNKPLPGRPKSARPKKIMESKTYLGDTDYLNDLDDLYT